MGVWVDDHAMKVLVLDIGGHHVKLALDGCPPRKLDSGTTLTPQHMMAEVLQAIRGWDYDCVSVGYPGVVVHGQIVAEPRNMGVGWIGFDFAAAFGVPSVVVNDAAMQALGSYDGGTMLFLGLGTGLGSTMIVNGELVPMELGHLPYKHHTYEHYVGRKALERYGKRKWRKKVRHVIEHLSAALEPDYVVVGGGNAEVLAKKPKHLADTIRFGDNANAVVGGVRLWSQRSTP